MCWGDNSYRQIGPSFGGPFLVVPTQVPGLSNIKQVGAAWASSCALDAAGVVRCWGLNVFGELGRGFVSGFAGFPTPDLVVGLTHVVALAHGAGRAVCAIRSDDGELWCWGSNAFGQLGIGSVTPAIGTPTRASTVGGNAVFVATSMDDGPELGSGFVCALQGTGAVVCVGWNPFGTLGDGTTTDRSSFVPVILTGPAWNSQDITAGEGTSCATKDNGSVQCWGENPLGQLGVGDTVSRTTPTNVLGLFTSAAALTANSGYGCVLMTDGTAACMGDNWSGALGVGGGPNRTVATDVVGLVTTKNVTGISAGHDSHTCASLSDGTAKCWGSNADGEVGDGSVIDRSTPTTVSNLTGVLQITAGAAHSCALLVGGTIKCWGENDNGQLGDGTTTGRVLPVSVVGLFTSAIAIAAGRYHTCALLVDSTVQCWGANYYGQLGTNSTVGSSSVPVDVHLSNNGLLMNGVALSSGNDHSCAVAADGSLACWGDNYYDQLGDGTQNQRNFAMPISGVTLVSRIAAGWTHSCARRANGTAWCWGMNLYGEIGDGTLTPRPSPIQLGTQFP
jgi:alpha-tubulin suppressor-like RCC1 family protein